METTLAGDEYTGGWNVSCNGYSDGKINTNVSGGILTYPGYSSDDNLYTWSNGSNDVNPDGLSAETYYVTVEDIHHCKDMDSITLTEPTPLDVIADDASISCSGGSDGAIDLTVGGGTSGYDYFWYGPNDLTTTEKNIDNLFEGSYYLTVTDTNGCRYTERIVIDQPLPILWGPDPSRYGPYNISCYGEDDGAINVSTIVGMGDPADYDYQWTGPGGYTANERNIDSLYAGEYYLTVTDTNNCSNDFSQKLTQPDALEVTTESFNISCSVPDGKAYAEVFGGTVPYTYNWSNGSTDDTATSLDLGDYQLTVEDLNGCLAYDTVTITEPPPLNINIIVSSDYHGQPISCYNAEDGSLRAKACDGTAPFDYYWSNSDTDSVVNNISAGSYAVTVTDSLGCTGTNDTTVSAPPPLTYDISSEDILCYGNSDGSAIINVSGGTPPYLYSWSGGQQGESVNTLGIGSHEVTVSDINNCTVVSSPIFIDQPEKLTMDYSKEKPYCRIIEDGSILLSVRGGKKPYQYNWYSEAGLLSVNDSLLAGITGGIYEVDVVDANGCVINETIELPGETNVCVFIPSAFSPNFDGKNDTWKIKNIEHFPNATIEIYNRWGEMVYRHKGMYQNDWDGTYDGGILPVDSYVYIIELMKGKKPIKGNVTILK